jgi:hypothetical protein
VVVVPVLSGLLEKVLRILSIEVCALILFLFLREFGEPKKGIGVKLKLARFWLMCLVSWGLMLLLAALMDKVSVWLLPRKGGGLSWPPLFSLAHFDEGCSASVGMEGLALWTFSLLSMLSARVLTLGTELWIRLTAFEKDEVELEVGEAGEVWVVEVEVEVEEEVEVEVERTEALSGGNLGDSDCWDSEVPVLLFKGLLEFLLCWKEVRSAELFVFFWTGRSSSSFKPEALESSTCDPERFSLFFMLFCEPKATVRWPIV